MRHTPNLDAFNGPVCVTGGSGFIGSHVVRRLVNLGREVRCLILPGDSAPALDGIHYTRIDGDILDPKALDRAMQGTELVIHLAAIYALWLPEPNTMFAVNVDGTREVLSAARRAGVKRVVHTSSIAAVGHTPGKSLADERSAFTEFKLADPYVLSKVISEREALRPYWRETMDVVVVNPAFPFGARDLVPTPTGKLILTLTRGDLPFVMKGGFNGVDVGDVAEGHLLAASRGRSGERYILAGHNLTYARFSREVSALAKRSPPKLRLPSSLLVRLGRAAEVAAAISGRPPLFTGRSMALTAGRYLYFDTAKAERELGYMPGPLTDALADAIAWFSGPKSPHNVNGLRDNLRARMSL